MASRARSESYERVVAAGIAASPIGQVLVEESVLGWGEFELEVMRDRNDNVVIVCSIENIDPMGVHTGDSLTVAPQQSLTDATYQVLRDQAITVIRAVGVETGGSNVQFAVDPADGEVVVIEMNPRVSRSSALASKATGFPIAKIAARLAVGYALEEIANDITQATPASFEPSIDYVVVKWPRFAFEKFAGVDAGLTTHMKSVGEAMAIGRTFRQAFLKAMRSRELDVQPELDLPLEELLDRVRCPARTATTSCSRRCAAARRRRAARAHLDRPLVPARALRDRDGSRGGVRRARGHSRRSTPAPPSSRRAPRTTTRPGSARERSAAGEVVRGDRPSVVILGSGPNRIGQGIEFDYCCVHAAMTVRECGRDAVMINCNPETVSTDYDTSDRLYFEPLTLEDVLAVVEIEQPEGVIVQFGGQTPLRLAAGLARAGVPLLGTSVDAIDAAEDRGRFGELLDAPLLPGAAVCDRAHGRRGAGGGARRRLPLLVRPSYVLGGRAMEIVYSDADLESYLARTRRPPDGREIFLDHFLENAIEVDVDALCDGSEVSIGGIMQHVEEAGVHSGDSACVLPPHSLGRGDARPDPRADARHRARARRRRPAQRAVRGRGAGRELYVIEANPRASRTVPFVSKAIGIALAKLACRIMLGARIADLGLPDDPMSGPYVAVKEAVLPFNRFFGADSLLGPEMRSTGEVMGIARRLPDGVREGPGGGGAALPDGGTVFVTVTDTDKAAGAGIAAQLHDLGFEIVATAARPRRSSGWACQCARCARWPRARRTSSTRSPRARSIW